MGLSDVQQLTKIVDMAGKHLGEFFSIKLSLMMVTVGKLKTDTS